MNQDTGRMFIENTKYRNMLPSPQQTGIPQPPLETEETPGREPIKLPEPDSCTLKPVELFHAINERSSIREYTSEALTLEELSFLLWCTQGVKSHVPGHATFRTVPSAGARHALDTYLLINRISDLPNGLYRYQALGHNILHVSSSDRLTERFVNGALGQEMIRSSAVCFIWIAVADRMTWRYAERGYRYLFLDAGHVCQNLYLSAQAVESGVCAIAAFDDDQINDILGLNGTEKFVVYMASVGKKKI